MKLHKEGRRMLIAFFVILVVLNVVLGGIIKLDWIQWVILGGSLVFYGLIVQFFRNPHRGVESGDNEIVSPVDGKVVVIENVEEPEYFNGKKCTQISIFMSPLNVHVTRYPIGGEVKYSKYHPGKYLVAWHPKASTDNERTTVVIENDSVGELMYRQVAGALARRIVNYATEGEVVVKGSDSGFIKFGSRVDLLIPAEINIKVDLEQKVRGGETVIATVK